VPEYARVTVFDADSAALDALVNEINSAGAPPPGVPAKRITVLTDRANGKVMVAIRFGSEEDLRTGAATLEGMSPPSDAKMRRISVDAYEVVLDMNA
jgi:hypothetical protein